MTDSILIKSPLTGWLSALETVPDTVFAGGMAGAGIAIEPTGSQLCAPCDGIVSCSPNIPHAISLKLGGGTEILMHIGIDSVALAAGAFRPLVANGEAVRCGQALLDYDLEAIVRGATSAITPVLISGQQLMMPQCQLDRAVQVGDPLFELHWQPGQSASSEQAGMLSAMFTVGFGHGLHARPAARLAAVLRPFTATVTLRFRGRSADARSMVSVMALGIRQDDRVEFGLSGADADEALQALQQFFGIKPAAGDDAVVLVTPASGVLPDDGIVRGITASTGLALGPAFTLTATDAPVAEMGKGVAFEHQALQAALTRTRSHLESRLQGQASQQQDILQAHIELIEDPGLLQSCSVNINVGKSAAFAWQQACREIAKCLQATGDAYLSERAADMLDIEQQVLRVLAGGSPEAAWQLPAGCIVLAEELLPSHLLSIEPDRVAGICTAGGGAGSHAAIIAAARGIPLLVAAGSGIFAIEAGTLLALDATQAELHTRADPVFIHQFSARIEASKRRRAEHLQAAALPAFTRDGSTIRVYANLGQRSEVAAAIAAGAEGCGLLRTEFLFQDRRTAPSEDEQLDIYAAVAADLDGRVLTIRTMDIGGDKPIAYLQLPKEENPALGLRGVRTSFWREDLFETQLRAILRVGRLEQLRILLPMVNDIDDITRAKQHITRCAQALGLAQLPGIGIMVETPAAALMADQLAQAVDFLSIGSNDLSQYVLAVDRGHPQLANRLDALHPAVLRLIRQIAESARKANCKLSLCGGLASDPIAVPLLLGLGIVELSAVPAKIPGLKALVRQVDLHRCQTLADDAIRLADAAAVRSAAADFINRHAQDSFP